jgi:hypothetical protein
MPGTYKSISPQDIKPRRSSLNQLVDVIQEDVSGSATRRKYQVYVTGGVGPGVTSSLYQTVYDQDFTLQTANPIFDMTIGLFSGSETYSTGDQDTGIVNAASTTEDVTGKVHFPSSSMMMREKIYNYQQFAQVLLKDRSMPFVSPFTQLTNTSLGIGTNSSPGHMIEAALFISFKRLFARDRIRKETFAMRFFQTGAMVGTPEDANNTGNGDDSIGSYPLESYRNDFGNLNVTSISGSLIVTDLGASTNSRRGFAGEYANLVDASNTSRNVGLIFYDHGTVVLDLKKITSGSQFMSGTIDAMNATSPDGYEATGSMLLGGPVGDGGGHNQHAKFLPDFVVSASIDDIVDHIASCRMQSGSLTAMTFQNVTQINSTLYFCRAAADDFNYSTNPTFIDSTGRVVVIDPGQQSGQRTFTFPTTIGLHDSQNNLLAVAKLSRPIEKNDEKDITFRIRLDY